MAAGKIGETGSIEEVRLFATLLLVTFHVIGLPDSGLSLAYPHPLRFFADMFSNFRMPAFAFIAGYIYIACVRFNSVRFQPSWQANSGASPSQG